MVMPTSGSEKLRFSVNAQHWIDKMFVDGDDFTAVTTCVRRP